MFKGRNVSLYQAAAPAPVKEASALTMSSTETAHRLQMTVSDLAGLAPVSGVTYSVHVQPDTGGPWNTISVGGPSPSAVADRNLFPGAKSAKVGVLRTSGFADDLVAEETIDLS